MSRGTIAKLAAAAVAGIALLFLASKVPIAEWITPLQDWFRNAGPVGIVVFVGIFFVTAMLVIPCLPLTLAAGAFFGVLWGSVAVVLAGAISAAGGFFAGRYALRGKLLDRMRHNERFTLIDGAIRKRGWLIVGLLRLCPLPFGLANYLYGLTAVGPWHYMLATVIAMLPGNVLFVYVGSAGMRTLQGEPPRTGLEWILLAMALFAVFALGWIVRRIARETLQAKF